GRCSRRPSCNRTAQRGSSSTCSAPTTLCRDMRHMWYWQGLRWAPGGLLLLATAMVATVAMPWPARWLAWAVAVVVSARLHSLAGRYYARHFPYIRPGRLTNSGLIASGVLIAALIGDV